MPLLLLPDQYAVRLPRRLDLGFLQFLPVSVLEVVAADWAVGIHGLEAASGVFRI